MISASAGASRANRTRTADAWSRRHLSQSGTSFEEILRELRWMRADEYLRATDMSFGEISYALGFSNPNGVHRFYRAVSGRTPGEAREELRVLFGQRAS